MTKSSYTTLPIASALGTIFLIIVYYLLTYIPRDYAYAIAVFFLGILTLVAGIYLAMNGHDLIGIIITEIGVGVTASVCVQVITALIYA